MSLFYCRKCGEYIDQNKCPYCGYEHNFDKNKNIDTRQKGVFKKIGNEKEYKIIDGCCGHCGRHLSKVERKNERCIGCNSKLYKEYTKKQRIIAIIAAIACIPFAVWAIIRALPGAIIISIIWAAIAFEKAMIRVDYDFYHSAIKNSPYYKEKYKL